MMSYARVGGFILGVALIAFFLAVPAIPLAVAPAEWIANGQFENGFDARGVAEDWQPFYSGSLDDYRWGDEQWEPAFWDGNHGQSITIEPSAPTRDSERCAGIWQAISAEAGQTYQLTLHGLLRSTEGAPESDDAGFRVQWGVDHRGEVDWRRVEDWINVPGMRVYSAHTPGPMGIYQTTLTARSQTLTFFLRVCKAWDAPAKGVTLNLDAISLTTSEPLIDTDIVEDPGPALTFTTLTYPCSGNTERVSVSANDPAGVTAIRLYENGQELGVQYYATGLTATEASFDWTPAASGVHMLRGEATGVDGSVGIVTQMLTVGETAEWLVNGDFESGFQPNGVGRSWQHFDCGHGAIYWWDDAKAPGRNTYAQRISIMTSTEPASDICAGIYQRVAGLRVGATYRLRLAGHPGSHVANAQNLGVQYGLDWAGEEDWSALSAWRALPWNVYDNTRTDSAFEASFVAQSPAVTLFIRGVVREGAPAGEYAFSVDDIGLTGYQ